MPKYMSGSEIKSQYGISTSALHRWAEHGRINVVRTPRNKLYSFTDIQAIFHAPKEKICYARVSSDKQKNLHRQIDTLRQLYPDHELLSNIGCGLNFKRRSFIAFLERILRGTVQEVCVLYKDRLCRFGTSLSSSSASIPEPGSSWFTIIMTELRQKTQTSCPKTSYQLLQSLWRDITGNAQLGTERVSRFKTRRIRLCPTKAQKQALNDWFHTARLDYNQC